MYHIAIFIGIYSYIIFFLGISKLLYKDTYIITSVIYFSVCLLVCRHILQNTLSRFWKEVRNITLQKLMYFLKKNKQSFLFIVLLGLLSGINFIGALGPEHAFDALWYHLTLPKVYVHHHEIYFIPGGLLYYSAMPKLVEMLYAGALLISSETAAKIIHYSFGVLSFAALYKLSRMFYGKVTYFILLIFASNLVFAWESITAYVDLARTFYEILSLWAFLSWVKLGKGKWITLSAIMVGFAIAVKLIAIGSVFIFILLILANFQKVRMTLRKRVVYAIFFFFVALSIPLPWFIFSFAHTGNPFYPVFSGYPIEYQHNLLSPLTFVSDFFKTFLYSDDPVSPMYLMVLPLVILGFRKFRKETRIIAMYCMSAFILLYFTPKTGGGRFVLPYLAACSVLVGEVTEIFTKNKLIYRTIILSGVLVALLSIFYRGYANMRYIPVLIGSESKEQFLTKKLNFSYGDFYDTDRYFALHISSNDTVLLYGFHNLYYVNFSFIHHSWVKKGDRFTYIATQGVELPARFRRWKLVHENQVTGVKIYTLN